MKKILFISFLSISFYCLNVSCNRIDYSKEIIVVDSLATATQHYLFQLDSVDSNAVMLLEPMIKEDLVWTSDSLTSEHLKSSSIFLSKLKSGKKLVARFPLEYTKLKTELNKSAVQLKALKTDLTNSSIAKEDAIKYILDEENALSIISKQQKGLMGQLEFLNDYPKVRADFYQRIHKQEN
jgi:hypothetical protein